MMTATTTTSAMTATTRMQDKYAELGRGMRMMRDKDNNEDDEDEDDEDNKGAGQRWGTRMWKMRDNRQRGGMSTRVTRMKM